MSKRRVKDYDLPKGSKKLKTHSYGGFSATDNADQIVSAMIAKILRAPPDFVAPLLEKAPYLQGLEKKDLTSIAWVLKVLERYSQKSYVDYLYFLLHPISSPKKIRPPGMIANPLGTEIRCIRGMGAFSWNAANGEYRFAYSPTHYKLDTTGAGVEYAVIRFQGDSTATPDNQNFGQGTPSTFSSVWKTCRLIAAELQISVIQSSDTNQGKIICTPIYTSAADTAVNFAQPALPTSLDQIGDNDIVYDGHVKDGLRMIYMPCTPVNYEFHDVTQAGTAEKHINRMDYQGSIRGVPAGARIEVRSAAYFELTVGEAFYEIISDPSESKPDLLVGSIQNVLDGLSEPLNNMRTLMSLTREQEIKANATHIYQRGAQYMNDYSI